MPQLIKSILIKENHSFSLGILQGAVWLDRMLLMEKELELEKESVRKRNPIPYAVWLAVIGIGINSIVCLVYRKWNWNSCKIPDLPFLSVLFNSC